jgi:hypothetical protein
MPLFFNLDFLTILLLTFQILIILAVDLRVPFTEWMVLIIVLHEVLKSLFDTIEFEPLEQIRQIFNIHLFIFFNFGIICGEKL